MTPLDRLLTLSPSEKQERGLLYTPAEIAQQPATWQKTAAYFEQLRPELERFTRSARQDGWTVYLVGAGSSDYIGHALANLLRSQWAVEVTAVASTDLLTNREDLVVPQRSYLWISFSRSGDSPEAVAVLEQALDHCANVRHIVVSCNHAAKMIAIARQRPECFAVVLDDAVNDRSLAMTSSFTNMLVFGQMLANLTGRDDDSSILAHMCEAAEYLLEDGASLAEELADRAYRNACFIGAGALGAIARESALKLTELTAGNTRALSETTLGLRHGPMSSLDLDTLFVALVSQDERRQRYDADLVTEIRRKKVVPEIIAVGGRLPVADRNLYHPSFHAIPDAYLPAVDVIFGQLLGLFSSIRAGLKPDSPSPAGVISRVVANFSIYV